jgi:hypothetical protein
MSLAISFAQVIGAGYRRVIPPALSAAFCFQDVFWLDHLTTYSNRTVICGKSLFFFTITFTGWKGETHEEISVGFCSFGIGSVLYFSHIPDCIRQGYHNQGRLTLPDKSLFNH